MENITITLQIFYFIIFNLIFSFPLYICAKYISGNTDKIKVGVVSVITSAFTLLLIYYLGFWWGLLMASLPLIFVYKTVFKVKSAKAYCIWGFSVLISSLCVFVLAAIAARAGIIYFNRTFL